MGILGLISRVRQAFRTGAANPSHHYGMVFDGTYEANGSEISGFVTDIADGLKYPPVAIVVTLDGEIEASAEELVRSGHGWRFQLQFARPLTAADILKERIKVFALDHRGGKSQLKIDGAIQLSYVREAFAPPSETELVIDFGLGGKSVDYVRDGWCGQEQQHTWTEGCQSTISLPFQAPGSRYGVEILAWPFIAADTLPGQTMHVWIADVLLKTLHVSGGQHLLEFEVPPELTQEGSALIRLDLPDATAVNAITSSPDGRVLALAFRRLRLKRFLETEAELENRRRGFS